MISRAKRPAQTTVRADRTTGGRRKGKRSSREPAEIESAMRVMRTSIGKLLMIDQAARLHPEIPSSSVANGQRTWLDVAIARCCRAARFDVQGRAQARARHRALRSRLTKIIALTGQVEGLRAIGREAGRMLSRLEVFSKDHTPGQLARCEAIDILAELYRGFRKSEPRGVRFAELVSVVLDVADPRSDITLWRKNYGNLA